MTNPDPDPGIHGRFKKKQATKGFKGFVIVWFDLKVKKEELDYPSCWFPKTLWIHCLYCMVFLVLTSEYVL
jgi:hypothetical protein